ncbi:MAG: GvpL/GvpF family gas vesicle protein [Candidatus Rokubacteria bacterium]|nr:GvpL/GvpF family gas vesicle protein [Candidatus Rokubacteria bacterium]
MAAKSGWYLYAILSHEDVPPMAGIDGQSPLSLIAEEGMAALASPVLLAEFGEEALRRNLEDLRWLEEKVCLHESIVEAALAKGPVLPMKFGTIFLNAERIQAVLRRNARRIREALEFLSDKVEWGVKGLASPAALRASVLRNDAALLAMSGEAGRKPPGQAFFLRRKIKESVSAKSLEREEVLSREFLGAIQTTAVDLAAHPPLVPEAPRGDRIVLNLACLVRREGVEAFLAVVEQWNRGHTEEGFRLVTSGPWPPYHFVSRLDDEG